MSEKKLIAGRYEIIDLIGRGGMGDVYRGRDIQTGDWVAIKILHAQIVQDNPQLVDRFEREGQALRRLNHPNIVKVLGTIQEDGQHYLVMEYMSGGSLRDLVDKMERLPIEQVMDVALDLADALTRAHRLNIIHRDIKPDNVLLADDGTPRLTDFGVAHLGDRTRLTQTGSVIGTYAYLSPEACNGEELDERADIWSFGVMLFEMLAGRLPFDESGTAAMLTAILTKPAPDITRLRPDIPPELAALIGGMLVKERENRISSVRLVGAELEALMRGEDTPLGGLLVTPSHEGSRFATPPSEENKPAHQTHGLEDIYPAEQDTPPPTVYVPGQITPSGVVTEYGQIVPVGRSKWPWIALMVSVLALAVVIMFALGLIFRADDNDREDSTPAPNVVQTNPTPTPLLAPEGRYLVLVADFEQSSPDPRPVSRLIASDLEQQLVVDTPFSRLSIAPYNTVIRSNDEARAAANASGATVIVWGSYTRESVDVHIDVGQTDAFPRLAMEYGVVERTTNIRLSLVDPQQESVARQVLATVAGLQLADGDLYEFMRTVAVMTELQTPGTAVEGHSVAAHYHRYFTSLFSDPALAAEEMTEALADDATNPLAYALRIIALLRQGDIEAAQRDAETAARLPVSDWPIPYYLLGFAATPEQSIGYYSHIIEMQPDDWYPYALRGASYYQLGDYEHTTEDLNRAIELNAPSNFPYALLALGAIVRGQMDVAATMIMTSLENYPEPDLYSRIVTATFGEQFGGQPALVAAFMNVSLARYNEALEATETGLAALGPQAELYTLQGYAYCNLGDYAAAEQAYTRALELDSDPTDMLFTYLLRADVRLQQQDAAGADEDLAVFSENASEDMAVLVDVFRSGEVNCTNIFGSAATMAGLPMPEVAVTEAATLEPLPPDEMPSVAPVEANEYMVLVAELEAVGGVNERDVTRFVVDELTQTLEVSVPFSDIRIRRWPRVITSDAEALAAAEATGATVVVWGNYSPTLIELDIQLGKTDQFPYISMNRALLERTANVRVRLTDERAQSVAPYVIGLLGIMQIADGNGYEAMRTMAILDAISVTSAEVTGNSVASHTHRYFQSLLDETPQAIGHIDAALELDTGNPILYAYRSIANQRAGRPEPAMRDAETAARLGPADWTSPILLQANLTHDEQVLDLFTQVVELRPDDWFPLFFRASVYYDLGQFDLAQQDLDRAIELEPNANFPYIYRALLAMHEGRMDDAARDTVVILTQFPNPSFMAQLVRATFGEGSVMPYSSLLSSYVNLTLGRYDIAINEAAQGLYTYPGMVDLHVIQGVAYCSLGATEGAERSLTRGIDLDPNYMLVRLLRAAVRLERGDTVGADEDFAAVENSAQHDNFDNFMSAIRSGTVNCANLFDPANPILATYLEPMATAEPAATPEATEPVSTAAAPIVEPVLPGEYMVLVAPLEPLGGVEERDVTRFIIEDLQQVLEEDIPFSNVRIRTYPTVIRTDEEAVQAAAETGASVVVWGSYSDEGIDLEIQIGVTDAFPYIQFDRTLLERTANARVHLTNERRESVALNVMVVLNVLAMADGGEMELVYILAIIDQIDVTPAVIEGNSVASHIHRAIIAYLNDTPLAIEELTTAIDLDAGNPIPYVYRSLGYLRLQDYEKMGPDLQTAARLAPADWTMILYLSEPADPAQLLEQYRRVAELRPNDWFIRFVIGTFLYEMDEIEQAKALLQEAISLQPVANLPHIVSIMIALREGDIPTARAMAHTVITEFPDPSMTSRVFEAIYGNSETDVTGLMFAAGTNLILGQYSAVVNDVRDLLTTLQRQPDMGDMEMHNEDSYQITDVILFQGLAQCNLGNYVSAEVAFSWAIQRESTYPLLYVLRGEVRELKGETAAAGVDFDRARDLAQGTSFEPWIEAAVQGKWTCANFFDYELEE